MITIARHLDKVTKGKLYRLRDQLTIPKLEQLQRRRSSEQVLQVNRIKNMGSFDFRKISLL